MVSKADVPKHPAQQLNGMLVSLCGAWQAALVKQINAFLGMGKGDFTPQMFQPGVLLCILCILLWTLCVYKDLQWDERWLPVKLPV